MLKSVATNLWVAAQPLRFFGVPVGCRMTCIRLADGAVVLHSPIRPEPALVSAVREIGRVEWLIAPNAFHHLFVGAWREHAPDAATLVAPRLLAKRRDLEGTRALDRAPAAWGDELELAPMAGCPVLDEWVFFHRPSATLVITDLAFHFGREAPFGVRSLIRLTGRLGELSPTVLERLLVRDRDAFRRSLEQVLAWPFERVVVSHGEILEHGGREALARGYDWLLTANRNTEG